VKLTELSQRPSTLPVACVPVAHEPVVGRRAVWMLPARRGPVLVHTAAGGSRLDGTSVPTYKIAGAGISAVNAWFTGDARGVPPRGRPV
jgi:hypothetical protein